MTCVAGIIVNLVPYHHARWEAFARSSGAECHLLELTNRDAFKVLEFSAAASYQRHTLFPRGGGEMISATALRRAMTAKLDAVRPDVVCVSGWALPVSLAALDWAAQNRVPAVMLSESNEFDEPRSAHKEWIKRRIVALCSTGLAGGTPQANYLVKLGLPRECIFLGYDVVDNAYFADKVAEVRSAKCEVRSKYGLPENYFLACCRFGLKKNVPRLVEAYAKYRAKCEVRSAKCEVWDLVIVGDGEKRAEIEAAIGRFGLHEFAHLAGAKSYPDIPAHYALADAFIHASTTEQWGLVVNEAMASGLPVLVSNRCGCATDLVKDGVNGFTFDPFNVEELAELMLRMWSMECGVRSAECGVEEGSQRPEISAERGDGLTETPKHSLAEMGDASRAVISEWGPERFASGLKLAVDKALEIGPKRAGFVDRLLLKFLSLR
jgi:glycosyltransferase involved in cell wall biosynthesis